MRRSPVRIINDTRIYWILIYIQCSPQVCISWQNVVYFLVRKRVFLWFLEPLRHFEPRVPHIFVYFNPCSRHGVIHFISWACHFKGSTETCYTLPMSVTEASKDSLSNILLRANTWQVIRFISSFGQSQLDMLEHGRVFAWNFHPSKLECSPALPLTRHVTVDLYCSSLQT